MERAEGATDPWSIRQVAAYHSFDVETGRSVWITVKGNDLLQRRIMEDTVDLPVHQGAMGLDVGAAFDASLVTHLVYFRWCEENWRWYIRDMEQRIRSSLIRAKTVPVDSEPRFTTVSHNTRTCRNSAYWQNASRRQSWSFNSTSTPSETSTSITKTQLSSTASRLRLGTTCRSQPPPFASDSGKLSGVWGPGRRSFYPCARG